MPNSGKPVDRLKGYMGNVFKEGREFTKAWNASVDATAARNDGPPSARAGKQAAATVTRDAQDKALGQLVGAIAQGRRYDKNGKQIKK